MSSGERYREELPARRRSETFKLNVEGQKWFVTVAYYNDGRIGEVFIDTAKSGTVMREMMQAFAMSLSRALQWGMPVENYIKLLHETPSTSTFKALGDVLHEANTSRLV